MKWTDKTSKDCTTFGKLKCGDGFEKDNILYIKVNYNSAFDIIHNSWTLFHDDVKILSRNCEIIFH